MAKMKYFYDLTISSSPHVHSPVTTQTIMRDVLIALAPALVGSVCFFGFRALLVTLVSAAACDQTDVVDADGGAVVQAVPLPFLLEFVVGPESLRSRIHDLDRIRFGIPDRCGEAGDGALLPGEVGIDAGVHVGEGGIENRSHGVGCHFNIVDLSYAAF